MTPPSRVVMSSLVSFFRELPVGEQSDFIDAALTDEQLEVAYRTRRARRELAAPTRAEEEERLRGRADPTTVTAFVALQSPRTRAKRLADHFLARDIDPDLGGAAICLSAHRLRRWCG